MAEHNGYKKHQVVHTRKLEFFKVEEKIIITDYVTSKTAKNVCIEMPFHLHPDVEYYLDDNECVVTLANRKVVMTLDEQMKWQIVKGMSDPCLGWYSAGFYKKLPSPVILGTAQSTASLVLKTELAIW
jgi:hypothetical protein